ncbi:MAG: winged helix-turn-helix transcriptional regulator [Rhodospirillaceae bacterium]|nr:winged helix-turn-helix transcriptional regulator [Rhodospirillaceae bacterium]
MTTRSKPSRRKPATLTAVGVDAAPAPRPPFDHEQHLFFWLTQVTSRRDRHLALALRPHGLRVPDWRVLGLLYSRRGLSMTEVADAAAIDPTTLSRTVAQFARAGLLVRMAPVGDKRVTRLALTAEGERRVVAILPLVTRLNDVACAGLPEAIPGLMRWALGEMRHNLDASLAADAAPAAVNNDS